MLVGVHTRAELDVQIAPVLKLARVEEAAARRNVAWLVQHLKRRLGDVP